ncbi:lytic murein transglycosylase [Cochlodiniinecator piscidefendens]|uniref:lytic murein transglycosylase n=1 Tax=Cochlodiniinecator piscidefendens TaxID=2715756 RepID=UPI00140D3D85|nr:lytic murein transglycosylase [Cochlodiniinecator piscidefendens]
MRLSVFLSALFLSTAAHAQAIVPCGGNFNTFINNIRSEAVSQGHSRNAVDRFLANASQDSRTLRADRSQGVFRRDFIDFSRAVIRQDRLTNGRRNADRYASIFNRIESEYGVSRGVLLAFWALETDFGAVQGDFNTLNSLLTLGHDCRRPELFQPQIFAALELYERGDFDPVRTQGAWAGEIGMVQMLPRDILENGIDGDGDGEVNLKTSAPDALLSGARMLADLGWRRGEPWLQEIDVPQNLDWAQTGLDNSMSVNQWERAGVQARSGSLGNGNLQASVLLPMGRNGPAFLAYPNFHVYFEWNKSFVYVTTAAYFATRLEGAQIFDAGNPTPGLSGSQMEQLQQKLSNRGHDVGGIDGILGARTRAAVQAEQTRLGLPADAWPTLELLNRL